MLYDVVKRNPYDVVKDDGHHCENRPRRRSARLVSDRAVVSTRGKAPDLAADSDPVVVGVAVDTFHVFCDPQGLEQIARAGREGRIATYQRKAIP